MTDKERIEESEEKPYYETELYKETCEEVDNADGYDDLVRDIMDYKNIIKELENNQNAKAVEALQQIFDYALKHFSEEDSDMKVAVAYKKVAIKANELIKELGGKNE